MTADLNRRCLYVYHPDDDVHETVFLAPNRQAVDEYLDFLKYLDDTLDDTPKDTLVRHIIDLRESGLPPIRYLSTTVQRWNKVSRNRRPGRIAVLYGENIMVTLLGNVVNLLSKRGYDQARFFSGDERDAAFRWLREGDRQDIQQQEQMERR